MMATALPRPNPSLRRPTAKARTSSRSCAQVQVCQMPKSLCRMAGRAACCTALRRSSFGTVSSVAPGTADAGWDAFTWRTPPPDAFSEPIDPSAALPFCLVVSLEAGSDNPTIPRAHETCRTISRPPVLVDRRSAGHNSFVSFVSSGPVDCPQADGPQRAGSPLGLTLQSILERRAPRPPGEPSTQNALPAARGAPTGHPGPGPLHLV